MIGLRKAIENMGRAFRKKYGIKDKEKPNNIQEFLEQKKDKQPFYKDPKKKPWE